MGIMDGFKKMRGNEGEDNYAGAYEDDFYGDDFGSYNNDPVQDMDMQSGMSSQGSSMGVQNPGVGMSQGSGMGMGGISLSGSAIEMKVVKPESYASVSQIADHLLNKRTVVLNLEKSNAEESRRIIDFLSGVAYSIDGSLKKIAKSAYVITPSNVDVGDAALKSPRAAEPKAEAAENGEY
jgi:cell division inhibitor SepF